ncbi:MAG: adenylate/guanylate cyclase domain-containing response regulator [Chloroflexota bacterium]
MSSEKFFHKGKLIGRSYALSLFKMRGRRQVLLGGILLLCATGSFLFLDFARMISGSFGVAAIALIAFAIFRTLASGVTVTSKGLKFNVPFWSWHIKWSDLKRVEPFPFSQLFPPDEISPTKRNSMGGLYQTTAVVFHLIHPIDNWSKKMLPWYMLPYNRSAICVQVSDWSKLYKHVQAATKSLKIENEPNGLSKIANPKTTSKGLDLLLISAGDRAIGQLTRLLSRYYAVEIAKSGIEAIQVIRKQYPTLILIDQNLPDELSPAATIQTLQKYQKRLKSGFLYLYQSDIDDDDQFELMEIGVKAFLDLRRNLSLSVRQITFWYDWQSQAKRMVERNQELYGQNLYQRSELARHGELMNFLPKNVAQEVIAGTYRTATHRLRKQKVTVLFADIVEFTPLSAQLTPEVLAELLNDYLQEMTQVVVSHEGIVDKFIGDEVMAVFGAPEEKAETIQVHHAFSAALSMLEVVKVLDKKWSSKLPAQLDIRVGINTGECTTGVFGSKSLQSYTVIGSPVNLAARLTSAAAPGAILTCENSLKWVKQRTHYESVGGITLKGISHPVKAFQILGMVTVDEIF